MYKDHPAFHIASNLGKFQPEMTNNFRVIIHDLDKIHNKKMVATSDSVADVTSEVDDAVLPSDTDLTLKIAAESFQEPSLKQNSVSLKRGNMTMEFPSDIPAFESSSTFTCFADSDSYGKLYAWKLLAGNHETGEVGDPWDYMRTVTIEQLDGKGRVIGEWTLNYCWLASLSGAKFDNNSANIKQVEVTLKYFAPTWRKANREDE